ncbi:hypothetical protein IC619_009880 [Hazenella sp. IB182353]|uniref:hypothetical protein n=1 Tax=Polycladospora coralii TaxID=2771432 RepID=UPI001746137D|nr:hypothetical protein [Polycladospora coralii]MBS7530798.1 hypothetical protein [Polycladospora coralii]
MKIKIWFDAYERKLMVCHLETGMCKEIVKPGQMKTFLKVHALTLDDCQYPVEAMDHMGLFKKNTTFQLLKEIFTSNKRSD